MIIINQEFIGIFIILLISFILSALISGISYKLGDKNPDLEKISVYECGFDPFNSSRILFSVKFFLVGVLFLIFDLEISFLFPWSISYHHIGIFGNLIVYLFLIILTIGFIYEWVEGGLDWE